MSRFEQELLKDKESVRKEYQRLIDLQEDLRANEEQRKLSSESIKSELKRAKEILEKEKSNHKLEIESAWRDLKLKLSLIEQERKDIAEQNERNDQLYREKVNELEGRRAKLIQDESEMYKRKKVIESKEFELQKLWDEYQTKSDILTMERLAFEKEARRVHEIARKINNESSEVNKILKNFDENSLIVL